MGFKPAHSPSLRAGKYFFDTPLLFRNSAEQFEFVTLAAAGLFWYLVLVGAETVGYHFHANFVIEFLIASIELIVAFDKIVIVARISLKS